jgi:putative flippase GtrA
MIQSQHRRFRAELARLGKSLAIGAAGTLVDLLALAWLVEQLGSAATPANLISYSLGVVMTFALNRAWAYPASRRQTPWAQLGRFVAVNGVGLLLNTALVALGLHLLAGRRAYVLAKLAATGIVFCWNFSANRLWTFRHAAHDR